MNHHHGGVVNQAIIPQSLHPRPLCTEVHEVLGEQNSIGLGMEPSSMPVPKLEPELHSRLGRKIRHIALHQRL